MKKFFALLLALVMALSLVACGEKKDEPKTDGDDATYPEYFAGMDELITAAKAEGELVVYGSCEEEYLAAACQHFEELFGIKTQLSSVCPPVRCRPRSRRRTATPPLTSGSAAPLIRTMSARLKACWSPMRLSTPLT